MASTPFVESTNQQLRDAENTGLAGEPCGPVIAPHTTHVQTARLVHGHIDPDQEALIVAGLHGGSGATTIQRIMRHLQLTGSKRVPPVVELGHGPRVIPPNNSIAGHLFVARVSAVGIWAAHAAAIDWANGVAQTPSLGIVWVEDGLRLPRHLVGDFRRCSRMFPNFWRMPWIPAWHQVSSPSEDQIRSQSRKLTKVYAAAATPTMYGLANNRQPRRTV